jgi:hypothetical protein
MAIIRIMKLSIKVLLFFLHLIKLLNEHANDDDEKHDRLSLIVFFDYKYFLYYYFINSTICIH